MTIEVKNKIVNTDITFLFEIPVPIFDIKNWLNSASFAEDEKFQTIDAEGLRLLVLPNKGITASAEQNRFIIRDFKPDENNIGRTAEIAAKTYGPILGEAIPKLYGFNFISNIELSESQSAPTFISNDFINKIGNKVKINGVNMSYSSGEFTVRAQIDFVESNSKNVQIAFNFEIKGAEIPNEKILRNQQKKALEEMRLFIKKIFDL